MSTATRCSLPARARRGRPGPFRATLAIATALTALGAGPMPRDPVVESPPTCRWTLLERTIVQDQGDWQVDYHLRLDAAPPLGGPLGSTPGVTLKPADFAAVVDGWVSNARVAPHATPRRSTVRVAGSASGTGLADLIRSPDDARACRERLVLRAWTLGEPIPAARPKDAPDVAPDPLGVVAVPLGGTLRLRLAPCHFLYGPHDPLLGPRDLEVQLGGTILRDLLATDREHYMAFPKAGWPAPPDDRRDDRHSISGPDSLILEAHVPGNGSYRYEARPVRYAARYRLSFWYLAAPGGEGEFRLHLSQYRESPTGWQILHGGAVDQTHGVVGRWTRVERIITTEPEATSVALDFKLYNACVGEVWIDDVSLEPCLASNDRP